MTKKLTEKINTWKKLKLPTEVDIEKIPIELLKNLIEECKNFLLLSKKTLSVDNNFEGSLEQKPINSIQKNNNIDAYQVDEYLSPHIPNNINEGVKALDIMDRNYKKTNNKDYLSPYIPKEIKDNINLNPKEETVIKRNEIEGNEIERNNEEFNIEEDLELENLIKEVIKKEK